jgi:hypothetical protein
MTSDLDYSILKEIHRSSRSVLEDDLSIRIHRSLSWLQRAECEKEDPDAAFIFYWISFNANYSITETGFEKTSEGRKFKDFFSSIISVDKEKLIYSAVWNTFTTEIRSILNNEYIYANFWQIEGKGSNADWKKGFNDSKTMVAKALSSQNTEVILQILFSRLYTLRNQLVHGNATWNGKLNRKQVTDGYRLISSLQPIFIYLMLKNPANEWGSLAYPIIKHH